MHLLSILSTEKCKNFLWMFHILLPGELIQVICEYVGLCFPMHRLLRYIATPTCVNNRKNKTTLTVLQLFSPIWWTLFLVFFLHVCYRRMASMRKSDRGSLSCPAARHSFYPHSWQHCHYRPVRNMPECVSAVCGLGNHPFVWIYLMFCVYVCREKDMDHAIRIPEMGVSKVWTVRIKQLRPAVKPLKFLSLRYKINTGSLV